jgi:hypothetical protein
MVVSLLSMLSTSDICYTCNDLVIVELLILHVILFVATYLSRALSKMLILTLLIFYVSRVGVLQFGLEYFVYEDNMPSIFKMQEILFFLLLVSVSLLAGCMGGESIGLKKTKNYKIFMFSDSIKNERLYYMYLILIYIFTKLVLIYLAVDSGVGLGIDRRLFDPILLRIAKIVRVLGFLGVIPICWLILKNPQGVERKVTLFAIVVFVLSTIASGSKTALLYSILPFIFVYYVTQLPMPRAFVKTVKWTIILSLVIVFPAMAEFRIYLAGILAGNPVSLFESIESGLNLRSIILSFASRVGSSFDVFSFVVSAKDMFVPYANLMGEFINVINGYYPGGIFPVTAPEWSSILYSLGHNADLELMSLIATGENITLPAHLYINFDLLGMCFWSFFIMFTYGLSYNYFNIIFVRVFIILSIIFDITNGGGFVSMSTTIPIMSFYMIFVHISYKLAHPFMASMSRNFGFKNKST